MDDAAGRSFLHESWRHKSPDVDLLSHVLPRAKCLEKTFSYRLSRVYGYNEADHFMDAGEIETSAAALGHATDKALKTAAAALGSGGVKLSTHRLMIVGFLKSQLQTGCVFSVPEAIFATLQNKCEPDEGPEEETAGNFTLEDIAGALIPRDVAIRKAEDHVYSYVVDAQPERRHQQLGVGKVANRSVIHCIRFMQVNLQDPEQPRVSYTSVQRHDLDLSAVATQAGLEMMSSACVIWLPQCTSLQVKLLPELSDSSTGHALQAPLRLPALTSDQDTLWDRMTGSSRNWSFLFLQTQALMFLRTCCRSRSKPW